MVYIKLTIINIITIMYVYMTIIIFWINYNEIIIFFTSYIILAMQNFSYDNIHTYNRKMKIKI